MREVRLSEKNVLGVGPASFEEASKLKDMVLKNFDAGGVDFGSLKGVDITDMDMDSKFVQVVVDSIKGLESNGEITDQILKCAEKCTFNGEKIIPDIFEDPSLWPHLIEIKIEILKENVYPFLKGLPSIFSKVMKKALN